MKDRFKRMRETLGYSQIELTDILELRSDNTKTSNTISKWESGISKPSAEVFEKLVSKEFEKKTGKRINIHWLLTGEGGEKEMFILNEIEFEKKQVKQQLEILFNSYRMTKNELTILIDDCVEKNHFDKNFKTKLYDLKSQLINKENELELQVKFYINTLGRDQWIDEFEKIIPQMRTMRSELIEYIAMKIIEYGEDKPFPMENQN